jgi:hypothetical protein
LLDWHFLLQLECWRNLKRTLATNI